MPHLYLERASFAEFPLSSPMSDSDGSAAGNSAAPVLSETDAKLKWLFIRKNELEQRLAVAITDGSKFAQFMKNDLDQLNAEIAELIELNCKPSTSMRKLKPEQARWRLVGKAMCEACGNHNMQEYVRRSFEILHANVLKNTIKKFQLKRVQFLLTSGNLSDRSFWTLFRFCAQSSCLLFEHVANLYISQVLDNCPKCQKMARK